MTVDWLYKYSIRIMCLVEKASRPSLEPIGSLNGHAAILMLVLFDLI